MDYATFVAARRHRWDIFESHLAVARRGRPKLTHEELEGLAVEYRVLLHDHALAQARFTGTGAARRLEKLVVDGTRWLRGGHRGPSLTLGQFYRRIFPKAIHSISRELAVVVVLFALAAAFGFVLGAVQPDLGLRILGPEHLADLKEGRLWTESLTAVMPAASSAFIATNNLSVALTGWAGGAAAGLGAFWITLFNGLHLGTIFAVTAHYGMSTALAEFVAAHGPLEITVILVCSAAGLAIGRALVVAQDRPRGVELKEQSLQSLVVLAGTLPWLVVLALVESIISPSEAFPAGLKLALGACLMLLYLSLAFNPRSRGSHHEH
jgi:uncharacterized membrane protein SpoIIM required for sporulation